MAKINVLDSSIYNRIAAGEVVERPASVVKELVENSIDAGATNILIEIEQGGIRKIKIVDNGSGVEKEYIREAFMPHATSKIASADDLDSIMTLGFRGEALASIASVSHIEMTSKTHDSDYGSYIELEAGQIIKMSEVGAKDGTTMVVSDLFFNVPARAKFLKKPKSEEQEVTNLVSRLILANPSIAFRYIVEGRTVISSPGKSLKDAMFGVYGKEVLHETLPVELQKDNLKISGFIGKPSYSKPNRTYQTLIVNGRYINDILVGTAIQNAYGEMLMKRKYAFFVLNLEVPYGDVDANVHPNKREVRFAYPSRVYSLVFEAVSRALHEMDYVVSAGNGNILDNEKSTPIFHEGVYKAISDEKDIRVSANITEKKQSSGKIDKAGVNLNVFSKDFSQLSQKEAAITQEKVMESVTKLNDGGTVADNFGLASKLLDRISKATMTGEQVVSNYAIDRSVPQEASASQYVNEQIMEMDKNVRLVGKAFNTYLIVQIDDDIFFIDQHAAHERILYEKLKAQVDKAQVAVQPLLIPYILTVNAVEAGIIDSNIELMQELGFEIFEFGENSFKVGGVPAVLSDINFDRFFSEFLTGSKFNSLSKSELIKESLMQASCKSAVKGGDDLSISEIKNLFKNMSNDKIPLFCPHGRPIAVRVTKKDLEKWFKRIV